MMSFKIGITYLLIFGYFTYHAKADFSVASPDLPIDNFVYQGNGTLTNQNITLTLAQPRTAAVLYWSEAQNVLDGFTTTFTYQSLGCDNIIWSQGADGVALFIAPSININEDISYGGTLGLQEKTNIAMLGFVLWQGRIVFTKTDVGGTIGPANSLPYAQSLGLKYWRCAGDVSVTVDYTPPSTFRITAPKTNTDETIELNITQYFTQPTTHFIGLSAATGDGYMQQSITTWDYEAKFDLAPILECYEDLGEGIYIAHFGHENFGTLPVNVDIGPKNSFSPGNTDRGQPKTFQTGRSGYYPINAFSIPWFGQTTTWILGDRQVTVNTANTANLCPSSLKILITLSSQQNLTETQLAAIVQSIADFLQISATRITVVGFDYGNNNPPPGTKRSTMQVDLATLELEISNADTGSGEPSAAQSVQNFVQSAANTTRLNEVLNPDGVSNVGFVSSELQKTGSELYGDIPGPPSATPSDDSPISTPIDIEEPSTSPSDAYEPQTTSGPESAVPIKGVTPQQPVDATSSGYVVVPVYYTVIMFVLYVVAL